MKLALITDGNGTLGMGHLYQTIALSHYLEKALGQSSAAFSYCRELDAVLTDYPDAALRVRVMTGTDRVAEVMRDSDLVMASPGLSVFKALSVGTPVLCFHQNSFQQDA
jgi:spore coat polysaccharide biosynthesis predicted glycosyltransferase SpsG